MKLQFDKNLEYQLQAIASIVDLFRGQTPMQTNFTVSAYKGGIGLVDSGNGIGNRLELDEEEILKNLQEVQLRNGLPQTKTLKAGNYDFDVEMETGTGKTYVYLRTILELHKKYGFSTDAWCEQFATWSLKQVTVSGQTLYQYLNTYGPIDDNMASGMWPVFKSGKSSNVTFEYSKAYGGNYTPKAGDIIWYQWKGSSCRGSNGKWDKVTKCVDHVGIVTSSDSNYVYTIEGNTGDPGLVRKRERVIDSDEIIAYGSWYK